MSRTLLTSEEAARYLRCSVRTLGSLATSGRVPHRRPSGTRRCLYDPAELDLYLDGCQLETKTLPGGGRVVRPIETAS